MKNFDIAIIGAGAAGLSIAAFASQVGAKVVLFEKAKMGGDCLNYGCVPSKSLIAAAKSFRKAKFAEKFGANVTGEPNFSAVMGYVQDVIKTIEKNDSEERFASLGVTVVRHFASFVDKNTIHANGEQFKAKKIVIATGSQALIPNIPGLENVNYLTNETIFELLEKPSHLIIIGAGPIGCELAQAFAMLNTKVTIIDIGKMLVRDEPDCVDVIKNSMDELGVEVYESIKINEVLDANGNIEVKIEKDGEEVYITGSHLLVAAGRKLNLDGLNLEKAGIKTLANGKIVSNQNLATSTPNIFVAGDVVGAMQFTHVASYHAGILIKKLLFKKSAKVNYSAIPWVTYTEPELSHVGLTEVEAKAQYKKIKVLNANFSDVDRAIAENKTVGKIKVIANKKGDILGASIVGENAGELLTPWIIAIQNKLNIKDIADLVITYPTFSEIHKKVAFEFFKPLVYSRTVKILVKILSWF